MREIPHLTARSSRLPFDGVAGSEAAVLLLHRGLFGVGESQFDQSSSKSSSAAEAARDTVFEVLGFSPFVVLVGWLCSDSCHASAGAGVPVSESQVRGEADLGVDTFLFLSVLPRLPLLTFLEGALTLRF